MMIDKNKKILVVGLGLIGGSYAAALSRAGYEVGGIDRMESAVSYARKHGMIAHGMSEVIKEYVESFDIVVFALYPHVLLRWAEDYASYIKQGAFVTDVTGVKSGIVYRMQTILEKNAEFIGAHPMAGKECGGVENASESLFCGANYIVTPTKLNTQAGILLCEELGRILGVGQISILSPEKHDEMIGFLSQLTHCIAVSLMTCKDSRHLVDYTGDSFRDLTRIAKINETMWSELFLMNKEELLLQMDLFLARFTELKCALEQEDCEKIKQMMRLSTERRSYFDKKSI